MNDPLLYGYDDERQEIYYADTYKNGKYAFGIAGYEEIERAFGTEEQWNSWEATDWVLNVVCMKPKNLDVHFEFNKEIQVY